MPLSLLCIEFLCFDQNTVKNTSIDPKYFIRMYWTNFWQASAHMKRNILGELLIKICRPDPYASFGTIRVQFGQLFDPLSVFKKL